MISLQQLEEAINDARSCHPATGSDARLHPDVALLGAVYGAMIFRRVKQLDPASLDPEQRVALDRWFLPPLKR